MRITKVDIPKNDLDGLASIKMEKLQPIVLITGKNGSGKTRILNKIFATLRIKPTITAIKNANARLKTFNTNAFAYSSELHNLRQRLDTVSGDVELDTIKKNIKIYEDATQSEIIEKSSLGRDVINWSQIETSEQAESFSFFHFVPKELNLLDPNSFSREQLINSAAMTNVVGVLNLSQSTFSKIQFIQDRWFSATHQNSKVSKEEKEKAISDYERLETIIKVFLNTPLTRTIDDQATLFGFPLGRSNLSDGQKILIQFCLAIYSQEIALKDLILVLDEPENHLHPSVIIETINRIRNCVSDGQIWIATHSIPLLAHFDPSLIWYVENGMIAHAGKVPEKVLHSLLGDESEVAKLQDFISLPAQYASSRYAFESLLEPNVANTDSTDPQSIQIRTDLLILNSTGKLRILDYGAGKGRVISNISDLDNDDKEKLIEKLDYIAFDKFSTDKEICEGNIAKAFGNSSNRYYNDFNKLYEVYDKSSFDVVIMCNVLHEIDPKDWIKLFTNDGIISKLLGPKGVLLLVEDQQIPIGEKAYQKGFLVLDTPQLRDLFKISEKDTEFSFSDQRGDGRLKAHKIPKDYLVRIDANSRLAAIKSVSDTARENILEIREAEKNYKNGKLHGFWTQQFANAQLNLSELSTT